MPSRLAFLAAILACAAVLFVITLGMPRGHGATFAYAWSVQYSATLSWADPLPRYFPDLLAGFGGQDFFFYAPLPFWSIAALIDPVCTGCAPSTELLLGIGLVLAASGLSMFAFLRSFFAPGPALAGAVVYAVLPYHLLVDWFLRQAIGEFTAYAFIPLVALGMERIRRQAAGGWIMSLGIAGTAFSHLPTTLLAAHVFGVVALVIVALAPGGSTVRLGLLVRLVGYALLGLALSAVYWLPAVVLLDRVSPDVLFSPHFEAWRWLLGQSELPPDPDFARHILVSFLAVLPLLLGAALMARGPARIWVIVPLAVAVFLNTAASEPIWRNWIIARVQFPWRLMTLVDFATGVAAAVLAAKATGRIGRLFLAAALAVLVAATAFLAAHVRFAPEGTTPEQNYRSWFAAAEYLSPEMIEVLRARIGTTTLEHFDQGAILHMVETMAAEFAETPGVGVILDQRSRSLTVAPPQGTPVLSVPVQYWAFWQARTATGTALETRPNPTFGTLDILAPTEGFGDAPVTVVLPFLPSEQAGAAISLVALVLLITLAQRPGWRLIRRPVPEGRVGRH
jgi:hypothetical protein